MQARETHARRGPASFELLACAAALLQPSPLRLFNGRYKHRGMHYSIPTIESHYRQRTVPSRILPPPASSKAQGSHSLTHAHDTATNCSGLSPPSAVPGYPTPLGPPAHYCLPCRSIRHPRPHSHLFMPLRRAAIARLTAHRRSYLTASCTRLHLLALAYPLSRTSIRSAWRCRDLMMPRNCPPH